MRHDMCPAFLPFRLAQDVLLVGKTINFLRYCCQDEEWVEEWTAEERGRESTGVTEAGGRGIGAAEMFALHTLVRRYLIATNDRVMHVLRQRFKVQEVSSYLPE